MNLTTFLFLCLLIHYSHGCTPEEGKFQCENGNCVLFIKKCNWIDDCGDFSDEKDCACKTPNMMVKRDQLQCNNGKCIDKSEACNLIDDCGDGSDEIGCICRSPDYLQCNNKQCYLARNKCDGKNDCGDNSDEENCTCEANSVKCTNGKCLRSSTKCNFEDNCGDDSDETNCFNTCPPGTSKCNNGRCILSTRFCNGQRDCEDGSDESSCDACRLQPHNFAVCFESSLGDNNFELSNLAYPSLFFPISLVYFPTTDLSFKLFKQRKLCPYRQQLTTCVTKYNYENCSYPFLFSAPRYLQLFNNQCTSPSDKVQISEVLDCYIQNMLFDVQRLSISCLRNFYNPTVFHGNCSDFLGMMYADVCIAEIMAENLPMCGTFDYFLRHIISFETVVPEECQNYDVLCNEDNAFNESLCRNKNVEIQRVDLTGPFITDDKVNFKCSFSSNTPNAQFNVTFYLDGYQLIHSLIISDSSREVQLDQEYLQLGKSLSCRVTGYLSSTPHLTNEFSSFNTYYLGVVAQERIDNINETSEATFSLNFVSTLPYICSQGQNCDLDFDLISGFGTVVKGKCNRKLKALTNPVNSEYQKNLKIFHTGVVELAATKELPTIVSSSALSGQVSAPGHFFHQHLFRPFFVVRRDRNMDPGDGRVCSVSAYTNVITFDRLPFHTLRQGVFSYVKSDDSTLEIQMIHKTNKVCAVAVRELSTILLVDACMDGTPIFLSSSTAIPEGYFASHPVNHAFKLKTPSVEIRIKQVFSEGLSVQIYLDESFKRKIKGLCGNYDYIAHNDLFGISLNNLSNPLLFSQTTDIYAVNPEDSLFFGNVGSVSPGVVKDTLCKCRSKSEDFNPKDVCSIPTTTISLLGTFYPEAKPLQPAFLYHLPTKSTKEGHIHPSYQKYQNEFLKPLAKQTFSPTLNNYNEATAFEECSRVLKLKSVYGVCTELHSSFELHLLLKQCSLDLIMTGTSDSVEYSIAAFATLCELEKLYKTIINNPHSSLNALIFEDNVIESAYIQTRDLMQSMCAQFCKGACQMENCVCDAAHMGTDCSVLKTSIPKIGRILSSDIVDYRDPSRYHELVVELTQTSDGPNDVTCHINVESLDRTRTWLSFSFSSSRGSMYACPYDSTISKAFVPRFNGMAVEEQGIPALRLTTHFTQGESSPSNKITIYVYDSVCYQCFFGGACSMKENTCLIDGFCYQPDQPHPNDPSLTCKPATSTNTFTRKTTSTSSPDKSTPTSSPEEGSSQNPLAPTNSKTTISNSISSAPKVPTSALLLLTSVLFVLIYVHIN